ncbi:unnamed protein product [Effrenium voratum]|nr:unnamed protein product [Effrenium voratum]
MFPKQHQNRLCRLQNSDGCLAASTLGLLLRFSFFGLGSGQSDAYSQNDNPINPYSQFSDGSETVYKARNPDEVDRRKKALTAALTRFENTPEYIKTKQAQALKGNLLQAGGSMKQDMIYFSGEEGSAAYAKAREFSQKVSTLGVDGGNKQWAAAAQDAVNLDTAATERETNNDRFQCVRRPLNPGASDLQVCNVTCCVMAALGDVLDVGAG